MDAFITRKNAKNDSYVETLQIDAQDKIFKNDKFYKTISIDVKKNIQAVILSSPDVTTSVDKNSNIRGIVTLIYIKNATSSDEFKLFTYSGGRKCDFQDSTNFIEVITRENEHVTEAEAAFEELISITEGSGIVSGKENVSAVQKIYDNLINWGVISSDIVFYVSDGGSTGGFYYMSEGEDGEVHSQPAYSDFEVQIKDYISLCQLKFICDPTRLAFASNAGKFDLHSIY